MQKPFPAVMNAGDSEKGRDYASQAIATSPSSTSTAATSSVSKAVIADYRKLAREEYGRELQIWSHAYIVQGETEAEAKAYFDEYVHQKGDWEAATNLVETMGLNTAGRSPEMLRAMKMHFIGGWGGFPLIGTKEQIVDGLARLSALGLDGVVVSWPRYIEDMRGFPARDAAAAQAGRPALIGVIRFCSAAPPRSGRGEDRPTARPRSPAPRRSPPASAVRAAPKPRRRRERADRRSAAKDQAVEAHHPPAHAAVAGKLHQRLAGDAGSTTCRSRTRPPPAARATNFRSRPPRSRANAVTIADASVIVIRSDAWARWPSQTPPRIAPAPVAEARMR